MNTIRTASRLDRQRRSHRATLGLFGILFATALSTQGVAAESVVELQTLAERETATSPGGQKVELVNLNADVAAQYLLRIDRKTYHLQFPPYTQVVLAEHGIRYAFPGGPAQDCQLGDGKNWTLRAEKGVAYTPVCGGRVFVRAALNGWQQKIKAPDTMRQSWAAWSEDVSTPPDGDWVVRSTPPPAQLRAKHANTAIWAPELGIVLRKKKRARLQVGQWYPAKRFADTFVSVIKLSHIPRELFKTFRKRVNPLSANSGAAQENALVHLIAMDLDTYTLNWVHGTEHPGVAWSRRHRLPRSNKHGPDGFSRLSPFVPAAAVSPADLPHTIGTFSGGFQRRHGAFKWGERAKTADAHHYGFIEDGIVLSSLMPSLATVIGYNDGDVVLKTWTEADNRYLHQIRFARQNGVPLMINGGPDTVGEPGMLVGNWGHGNWSGSAKAELKTPRSAACLVEQGRKRWLIYAYFFTHTPSGMARILQAYACDYSVHLDMNSPGHAYFGLFTRKQPALDTLEFSIEHLMTQMRAWDPSVNKKRTPRYLLKPEYKDFFYIMRRQ